jgi:DNA-binding transcriptional ArsR family regulator
MPQSDLDTTFLALADPTRRAILSRLVEGEATVMDLAAPFSLSQPAISKHLKVLEQAGLVTRSRDGTRRPVHAVTEPLKAAVSWMDDYCRAIEARYQRLDGLLAELQAGPKDDDSLN